MHERQPCTGAEKEPADVRARDLSRGVNGRGKCADCGNWYKLNEDGKPRAHKVTVSSGFTPADEGLELPPDQPEDAFAKFAAKSGKEKTNPTPDLTDEQYMEQMVLIAQAIAVMPAQREGMPNVTVPPPIRPMWAKFMLTLGLRIYPDLATHKLEKRAPKAAGNFGPTVAVPLSRTGVRGSFNRADMAEIWKRMNPETYQGILDGSITREDMINALPQEMQEAARLAEQMRRDQAEEQTPPGAAP